MSLINSFPHSGEILHYYIKIKEGGGGEKRICVGYVPLAFQKLQPNIAHAVSD